jgi:hypothetical protein
MAATRTEISLVDDNAADVDLTTDPVGRKDLDESSRKMFRAGLYARVSRNDAANAMREAAAHRERLAWSWCGDWTAGVRQ